MKELKRNLLLGWKQKQNDGDENDTKFNIDDNVDDDKGTEEVAHKTQAHMMMYSLTTVKFLLLTGTFHQGIQIIE